MVNLKELECPKECPKRDAWCHSLCKQHELYRAEMERRRQARMRENAISYALSRCISKREGRFLK